MCPSDIAFPVPTSSLVRREGPWTSERAAAELRGTKALAKMQLDALVLVLNNPGCTANMLTRIAGHGDPRVVNRRLSELERADLVRRDGVCHDPNTNRPGFLWWPTTKVHSG